MSRTKTAENANDPATGRLLPQGVAYRGPRQYRAWKLVAGARVTKTFETARHAREWLEETAVAVRGGSFVDRRSLAGSNLRELVQRFVDEEMQDGGRRRGAADDRASHIPALTTDPIADLPLSALIAPRVREFRNRQLAKGLAPGTVVKRMNLLSTILTHARAEWDVPLLENPATAKMVARPEGADQKRNRRLMAPTAAHLRAAEEHGEEPPLHEEERLYAAFADSPWADDGPFVRFAIAQATRRGEALGLRWRDLDLDARLMTLHGQHGRGTKNQESRKERGPEVRPLTPEALKILKAMMPKGGEPAPAAAVFSVGGATAFSVRFGRTVARAKLEDLTFHDLRHEATSRLAKRYPNPLDLKRVTGHADLKSLDRYYQPDLTELAGR